MKPNRVEQLKVVDRMIRPEELKKNEPLEWSPGTGVQVWDMFRAAILGDEAALGQLLELDPALVRSHYVYRTPLYFAVRENQLEAARLLLDHGADPLHLAVNDSFVQMARDRGYSDMEQLLTSHLDRAMGASPRGEAIAAAIRSRDTEKVLAMLDADPDLLHTGDEKSSQPLHWAVMTRQLDLIDELLARGANINARRADNARPIHLSNGDYNYRGWRDVPKDVTTSATEVLGHLIARGAEVDICTAAHTGDLHRMQELLDADPTLANRVSEHAGYYLGSGAPLRNAAANGHLQIVELLLERGADPNLPEEGIAPHGHALYSAVANKHYQIAELLLQHGAYPNPPVESSADALSIALGQGNQKMVELLCSYGAARSVNLLSYSGDVQTAAAAFDANPALANDPAALANAAAQGHEAFVRLMLHHCPDLATRVSMDQYWVVGAKTRALNELLFEHGMNPSQPDWLRTTPLHHFAKSGDLERAALYLDHGADLEVRDEDIRSTPLGWAAKYGKAEMVSFLLERGAKTTLPNDPALEDLSWATPLAWATRRGHEEVVALLKQAAQDWS